MNEFDVYAQYKRDLKKEKKQRELDEKERIAQWKQERKEAKRLREIERKEQLVIEKNLKRMEKIEADKQKELFRKLAKEERIRNIVNEFFIITSDPKDKVQSSVLGYQINNGFNMQINSKIIYDVLLSMQGISSKKSNHCFFCGLKPK